MVLISLRPSLELFFDCVDMLIKATEETVEFN